MRRALVLTNEAARHPFRASLPPGVVLTKYRKRPALVTIGDVRDFLLAFCAFFLAALVFIA